MHIVHSLNQSKLVLSSSMRVFITIEAATRPCRLVAKQAVRPICKPLKYRDPGLHVSRGTKRFGMSEPLQVSDITGLDYFLSLKGYLLKVRKVH